MQLLEQYENVKTLYGQRSVVRNGYLPEREVLTGAGPVAVKVPKVRDRFGSGVKFNSVIVPPYVRKSPRVSAALPWLYLKGISTGDMSDALSVLLGEGAKGFSANVVGRLKVQWADEQQHLEPARSVQGALRLLAGRWAFGRPWKKCFLRRCAALWFHKMGNVMNALPASQQARAKAGLQAIWMAATRAEAHKAFEQFVATYQAKYPKAVEKLTKDRDSLLAFYDFPAGHWQHLRTTNPIESTFATVHHRTTRTRHCVSRPTFLGLAIQVDRGSIKSVVQNSRRRQD